MDEITQNPHNDPAGHYDLRIVVILLVFLGVCVVPILSLNGDSEQFPIKQTCQQFDISQSHLVSVDCDVIVDSSVETKNRSDMADFAVFLFQPIAINEASFELLQTIKGVGPKLAQQIITYRLQLGPFVGSESIKQLTGVGEKRAQYLATQFSFN